jgi:hypothetical protein
MAGKILPPNGEEPDFGESAPDGETTLDPRIQDALGKALRNLSEDIVKEPIPDKFLALLAQLEARERDGK